MILDELVLHNFGVYGGRHVIDLSPPQPDKPIILIGALNGGGKTTLLDGLNLVLFGRRARCAARGKLKYDEFLRRSIHRRAGRPEASVEIAFRHQREGEEEQLRVQRSWRENGHGISEQVQVYRNGQHDRVLTESWSEQVEEYIPLGISQLFLFDGEKIEALAAPDSARELLQTAVHSLLGLDLVDQLSTDLGVLARRKTLSLKQGKEREELNAAQTDLDVLEQRRQNLFQDRAVAEHELRRSRTGVEALEQKLRLAGGDLFAQRQTIEAEQRSLQARIEEAETGLMAQASGDLPLLLAQTLLDSTATQAQAEQSYQRASLLLFELDGRDMGALKVVRQAGASVEVIASLETHLATLRQQLREKTEIDAYLEVTAETARQADAVAGTLLKRSREAAEEAIGAILALRSSLVDCERRLAGIPDRDAIRPLIESRDLATVATREAEVKLLALVEALTQTTAELEQQKDKYRAQLEKRARADMEDEATRRVLKHSRKANQTLSLFRTAMLKRHTSRIEASVLQCFEQLLRKEHLITGLHIDPETFALELIGGDGHALTTERLSAGERQLLAVSMLWGLARASGRGLPAVIDTPLGRLDSTHRTHLIERYFPHASHQVLLLSTDEEINEGYFATLEPHVGRSYKLEFDNDSDSTRVSPGYFW